LNDRLYIASDLVFILSSKDQFKELFGQCCKYDIQRRPEKFFWILFLPAIKQDIGTLFMECSGMAPPWINVKPIDNTDSEEIKPSCFNALIERHKTQAGESP